MQVSRSLGFPFLGFILLTVLLQVAAQTTLPIAVFAENDEYIDAKCVPSRGFYLGLLTPDSIVPVYNLPLLGLKETNVRTVDTTNELIYTIFNNDGNTALVSLSITDSTLPKGPGLGFTGGVVGIYNLDPTQIGSNLYSISFNPPTGELFIVWANITTDPGSSYLGISSFSIITKKTTFLSSSTVFLSDRQLPSYNNSIFATSVINEATQTLYFKCRGEKKGEMFGFDISSNTFNFHTSISDIPKEYSFFFCDEWSWSSFAKKIYGICGLTSNFSNVTLAVIDPESISTFEIITVTTSAVFTIGSFIVDPTSSSAYLAWTTLDPVPVVTNFVAHFDLSTGDEYSLFKLNYTEIPSWFAFVPWITA